MKQKLIRWPQRYGMALRNYLKPGSGTSAQPASKLGREAVTLGLDTLELARIHEQALATLKLPRKKNGLGRQAEFFFTEANAAIEETHRAARQTKIHLSRLQKALGQRTEKLASTNRQLQQGILQRKAIQNALKKSGNHYKKCLEESLDLQKRLRQLTHRVLTAQEDERKKISCELQDEIAQTLLGIKVRLLSLKQESRINTRGFKKEIASTQRLVEESVQSINRFAHELDIHQPAKAIGLSRRLEECGIKLPAAADVARKSMKSVCKPERGQKKTSVSPAICSFPVIAMAASAGGLNALSVILRGLPADFPAAIAIVMHLSPDHKSVLAEILDGRSHLEVKQAVTGDFLCRSCVFLAPPNHHLLVAKGGRLKLSSSAAEKVHHARPSAEPLFASVAAVYKKNAIAVVLTGGDGDGSFGVQIIKDKGGMVIAQDRPTSQDFSMPESSIKTGDVDFILPLDEIASKLIELVGAGKGQKNGRTTAKRTVPAPALAKLVTPHFSTGTKDAMIARKK